jgi:hypothetical protein
VIPLVLSLLAVAPSSTGEVARESDERPRVLVLDLQGDGVREETRKSNTGLVAVKLARDPRVDVMSGQELKGLADLAADKQQAGCGLVVGTPHIVGSRQCGRPALVGVPGGVALACATDPGTGQLEVHLLFLDEEGNPRSDAGLALGQRPAVAAFPDGVAVAWQTVNGEESDVFAASSCLLR